jgi:hypothetical protein
MSKPKLSHLLDDLTRHYGHAEPVLALAGLIGHKARWEAPSKAPRFAAVVQRLAEVADLLAQLETEEAEEAEAERMAGKPDPKRA